MPSRALGRTSISSASTAFLVDESAPAGQYARHSGISFLKSGSSLVELYLFGTTDSRPGSPGCTLYGTTAYAR